MSFSRMNCERIYNIIQIINELSLISSHNYIYVKSVFTIFLGNNVYIKTSFRYILSFKNR